MWAAVGLVLAPVQAVEAGAQEPIRQTGEVVFDQQLGDASTGVTLSIDYVNPTDAEAKPYAVQRVVTELAPGTRIDTSVPARCEASDAQLVASGAAACPEASRVGSGEITLDTGTAGPARYSENNITLLNAAEQLVLLLEPKGGGPNRVVARAAVRGSTITSDVPPIPGGPPDGFLAIKRVRLKTTAFSADGRNYVRTPTSCPAGGWRNVQTFTYRDGVTQSVANASPCREPAPPTPIPDPPAVDRAAPRIRIFGVKRRGCTHRSFAVRVTASDDGFGIRSVELSLGSRRMILTKRSDFSRRIAVRRLRPGPHRVVVVATDRAGNMGRKAIVFRPCP